jgi:hypothetical protein
MRHSGEKRLTPDEKIATFLQFPPQTAVSDSSDARATGPHSSRAATILRRPPPFKSFRRCRDVLLGRPAAHPRTAFTTI